MDQFDLLGPLPARGSTTVLEASAGTGKTFVLAGLVVRYVADGYATLDQMLLITFGRAASQELRERVRSQIVLALSAFSDPSMAGDNQLATHLIDGTTAECELRQQRLRDALAGFDAATIATTHQFCRLVLRSLGVAGDTDTDVTLVEDLGKLITEVVDDLYLVHFGRAASDPVLSYREASRIAREVVENPATQLRPANPQPGSPAAVRVAFAKDVLAELEIRKRQQAILGYDDLLTRLAAALEPDDSPARDRMRQRWPIVMVDEFQDTDLVQWQVIDRAFSGQSTLILIGDPKQAIYAFRGGDIATYLNAAATAGDKRTLSTNWRSDSALVRRLHAVLRGAELGDSQIVVHDINAHHQGHRLAGAPHNDPFRLRVVRRETLGRSGIQNLPIGVLREHIGRDLAADIGCLLSSDATFNDRPLQARDIAVIVEKHTDARACHTALVGAGIPAVYTGGSDVFGSEAADDWLSLLEAFDQPHRSGVVRAAASTVFFGETAASLAAGGDALTDRITETLREWADYAREHGVAAIFEAAQLSGMSDRVLSCRGGDRRMTDLAHLAQLLAETAHREQHTLPALRDWLRGQREEHSGATEHNRRIDSDAAAVQIMTVFASKGLQFPIVYLPFAFNRNTVTRDLVLFHDEGARCLHIGGKDSPDFGAVEKLGRGEAASDNSRLTYVALTRAQSQVVAWWSPAFNEPNGGLSRLLRGRRPGQAEVPERCVPARIADKDAWARFREWEAVGGPMLEEATISPPSRLATQTPPSDLGIRHFHRTIDSAWRRTSYSRLISDIYTTETVGVASEPELVQSDDEIGPIALSKVPSRREILSPMAELPAGKKFGTLVHAVLETVDPSAPDLVTELEDQIRVHLPRWPIDAPAGELAAAMVPMHDTGLGPLTHGLTLRQIGQRDRLTELNFEFPLAGGDLPEVASDLRLADVGMLLRSHLPAADPLAPYADRLVGDALGRQPLRGYLSGSIDVILRVPKGPGYRYLVVDYKTNRLGDPDRPLTAADYSRDCLVEVMLHSDYPLQALLYSVVLHRFLRWRQPGYEPSKHLGGVLYLFVRGMCGASSPMVEGHPAGVFSWQPPTALVTALSDVLDGQGIPV